MKTPMQELIERFDAPIPRNEFIKWLIKNANTLLEKEKQVIIDANKQGVLTGWADYHDQKNGAKVMKSTESLAEQYYNSLTED